MAYFGVIGDVGLLFVDFAVFLSNKHQEIFVVYPAIFYGELY
jgi:hypothetical protein